VQIGTHEDMRIEGTTDMRGKLRYKQLFGVLSKAQLHIGIDSFPMHAAAIIGTPVVAIFGNTFPQATGPDCEASKMMLAVTPSDYGDCERPCHMLRCMRPLTVNDQKVSCINTIAPESVVHAVVEAMQ